MRRNLGSLEAQKQLLEERLSEIDGEMSKIRARRDEAKRAYESSIERGETLSKLLGNEDALLSDAENKLGDCEKELEQFVRKIFGDH